MDKSTVSLFLIGTSLLDARILIIKRFPPPAITTIHSSGAKHPAAPPYGQNTKADLTAQPLQPPQDRPPRYFLPSHYKRLNNSTKATNHHLPAKCSLGPLCCQTAPAAMPGRPGHFVTGVTVSPSSHNAAHTAPPFPHTPWDTSAHSVGAAQQRCAPICSYSCFQGNQCRAIYKGKKKTAATQSCDISTFLSCCLPPLPLQLPCDSRKGQ